MSGALREIVGLLGFDIDERSIRHVDNQLDRYQRRVAEVTAAQQRMSLGLWTGIAAGVLGNAWYQVNAQNETLSASLDLVTGSAEGTARAMAFISDFEEVSPDQIAQITSAYQMLVAQGLDPTMERMTAFGDSAAAVQTDVATLIDAISGGMIGNTERLDVLFGRFGMNFMSRNGELFVQMGDDLVRVGSSFAEIAGFVEELGKSRFAGGMERQAATMSGRISMLQGEVTKFLVLMGDEGMRDGFKDLVNTTVALLKENRGLARTLAGPLTAGFRLAATAMQWLADNQDKVQQGLTWLGTWVAGSTLVRLVHFLRQISIHMALVGAEALAVQLAVGAAFIGAAFIIDDFLGWLQGKDSVIGTFVGDNAEADGAMGDLARFFLDLREHGMNALNLMWADVTAIWDAFTSMMASGYDRFSGIIDGINAVRAALLNMVPEEIRPYLDWMLDGGIAGTAVRNHPLSMIARMVTGDFSDTERLTNAGDRMGGALMGGGAAARQIAGADGAPITSAGTERTWWQWMRGVDASTGGGAPLAAMTAQRADTEARRVTNVNVAPAEVNLQFMIDASPDVADQVSRRLQRELPSLLSRALEPAFERARLEE